MERNADESRGCCVNLGEHLRNDEYLRERLRPKYGDLTYLHLADLRLALEAIRTDRVIHLLDYGCGGSPYRSLFPNAIYKRADYLQDGNESLDYVLPHNSRVEEANQTFDFILSTQVIEHVSAPTVYLAECFRLLKPSGTLYITTHGTYPDHACPYDFYRWTTDGLNRDLVAAGFTICRAEKLTTGPRAALFHCDCQIANLWTRRRTLVARGMSAFRRSYMRLRPWLHKTCDDYFSDNRVVIDNLEQHPLYIVTACLAQRPS
jgi:SAM-dependent methyltransferase